MVGSGFEEKAAAYMRQQGFDILEQNYRCKAGEIDLVARDGAYLVFTEVKYRRAGSAYGALEAVDLKKQRRISKAALWYLSEHRMPADTPCRFDVAAFEGEELTYLKNAFSYCR